jgi:hypothetical protein
MIRVFADSTTGVTRIMFYHTLRFPFGGRGPHPSHMLGSFGMTKIYLRVLMMFWRATATIILIH